MADIIKKVKRRSKISGLYFQMNAPILFIDNDNFVTVEGVVTFVNETKEPCLVILPRIEWLWMQSKYFDQKKKFHKEQSIEDDNILFITTMGIVICDKFSKAGIAPFIDKEETEKRYFEQIENLSKEEIEKIEPDNVYVEALVFTVINCSVKLEKLQ